MRTAVQTQFQYRDGELLLHARDDRRAGHLPRRLDDDRGSAAAGRCSGSDRRLVRRLLHRLDARPEHEHRLRRRRSGSSGSARASSPGQLLRPIHPLHYDIAYFAGWKIVVIVLWLPIAVALSLLFDPTLRRPTGARSRSFAIAIWGAYLIRTMSQSALGMLCFWTTRGGARSSTSTSCSSSCSPGASSRCR